MCVTSRGSGRRGRRWRSGPHPAAHVGGHHHHRPPQLPIGGEGPRSDAHLAGRISQGAARVTAHVRAAMETVHGLSWGQRLQNYKCERVEKKRTVTFECMLAAQVEMHNPHVIM